MIWAGVLAMTLIGAMGAFFLKAGMDRVDGLRSLFKNYRLYLGGASRQVMINIYQALTRARDQRTASFAREALAVLRDDARSVEVKRDTPMDIGPVIVYSM